MKKPTDLPLKAGVVLFVVLYTAILLFTKAECPFKTIFSIPCPGCGMTRAWISVLKLNFSEAFTHHKMFWSVPIIFIAFLRDGKLSGNKKIDITIFALIAFGFVLNWLTKLL